MDSLNVNFFLISLFLNEVKISCMEWENWVVQNFKRVEYRAFFVLKFSLMKMTKNFCAFTVGSKIIRALAIIFVVFL